MVGGKCVYKISVGWTLKQGDIWGQHGVAERENSASLVACAEFRQSILMTARKTVLLMLSLERWWSKRVERFPASYLTTWGCS